jgi:phage shock protein A
MLRRVIRLIKSWFGYLLSFGEDPEVMLQQAAEEMRNTLPRLNEILISTRATVLKLESEIRRLDTEDQKLSSSIESALREGSPSSRTLAEDFALRLEEVRETKDEAEEQLGTARPAHQNAMTTVDELKRRLRARIELAQKAVEEHKRARLVRQAADALMTLDAYDTGGTTDKYVEQVRQRSAEAKAALEIATGTQGLARIEAERNVRRARAQQLLGEFEKKLDAPAASPEKKQLTE